jgi:hypothetical protein
MEIRKHIPEITAIGLAELGAGAIATKQAIEGNPMAIKELVTFFAFATLYVGIPAVIIVNAARYAYDWYKDEIFRNKENKQ